MAIELIFLSVNLNLICLLGLNGVSPGRSFACWSWDRAAG